MADHFLYEKDGAGTTITFNRPERRNCLNQEVMNELEGLLRNVRNDPEVRVLIVTGVGAAFSAGADTSAVKGLGREERARVFSARSGAAREVGCEARAVGRAVGRLFDQITRLDCMTIAAVWLCGGGRMGACRRLRFYRGGRAGRVLGSRGRIRSRVPGGTSADHGGAAGTLAGERGDDPVPPFHGA